MGRSNGMKLRRPDEADAIEDEGVAGEHKEEEHALEDAGGLARQSEGDLRRLAADIGERQYGAGDKDRQRIETAEEGDDDRGEAVAGRDDHVELADRAGDLGDAGKAGKPARNQKRQHDHAVAAEAGKGTGARRLAEDADLETGDGDVSD